MSRKDWKDKYKLGLIFLLFGALPLFLSIMGMLVVLFNAGGVSSQEILPVTMSIPLFAWGVPMTAIGAFLLWRSHLDE